MEPKIMPEYFEPRRRGNRPVYNVAPILEAMDDVLPGRWVAFELTKAQARSAKRQLEKNPNFDVSVEITGEETATVYARQVTQ